MAGKFCVSCGARRVEGAKFCAECGARQDVPSPAASAPRPAASASPTPPRPPTPPASPGPPSGPAPAARPAAGPQPTRAPTLLWLGLPVELWAVIALLVLPGGWLLIDALRALPDAFDYFDYSARWGFVLVLVLAFAAAVGIGLIAVGWLLYNRDRTGRGLSLVITSVLFTTAVFDSRHETAAIVALVLAVPATAVLYGVPAVRGVFDSRPRPHPHRPTSLVVGRRTLLVTCVLLLLVALLNFLAGADRTKYVFVGILLLLVAGAAGACHPRLRGADRQARIVVSLALLGGFVLVLLSAGEGGAAPVLGLVCGTVLALWIPEDARAFFGDPPLSHASNPRTVASPQPVPPNVSRPSQMDQPPAGG